MNKDINNYNYDVLVIGTGGAGLMAALKASQKGLNVACLNKAFATNSHTVAAQGGINAALGNIDDDKVEWHIYDTIRGSDFLADQAAVDYMCRKAPSAIQELEHLGVAFSRTKNGKLDQRIYGGQSGNYGKSPSPHRACFASDRTGHTILHTLYQKCLSQNVTFFNYHLVLDLLTENNQCFGVTAIDMESGEFRAFISSNTIIATGGYSQIYHTTTSSTICTGDGNAMILKSGLPLKDMEFIQFHPTGLYGSGFLISEAARAEGAYLTNNKSERFMEKYAPNYLDLAPRDVIARAIANEIFNGRGVGDKKDHVLLHLEHIPEEIIKNRLPEIWHLAHTYTNIDICKQPVPVVPSVHYTMGGIPTNIYGQVLNQNDEIVVGLSAIGEAACISVHGANRLGCNSLLDLIVFGTSCIEKLNYNLNNRAIIPSKIKTLIEYSFNSINALSDNYNNSSNINTLKFSLQETMSKYVGIYRDNNTLKQALNKLDQLINEASDLKLNSKSLIWNNQLQEIVELKNMLLLAKTTIICAINRTESRGSHYRNDYTGRDDTNWLKHSMCYLAKDGSISTYDSKVDTSIFNPEPRKY